MHGAGYEIRGARGWAHLRDIEAGTERALPDQLPPMNQRGYVERVDVRDPSRAGPVWVYRITPSGVRAIQELYGTTHRELPPLPRAHSKPGVYLPAPHRAALLVLRASYDHPATLVRFGERGWLTARELGDQKAGPAGAPAGLSRHSSLSFLHRKGFADRRIEPGRPAQQAVRTFWRATELGCRMPLLEWKPMPQCAPRPSSSPPDVSDQSDRPEE